VNPDGRGKPPKDHAHPAPRLTWLDLYRGTAVLVMIETHVLNTFLAPAFRATDWFLRLNYVNGLVAPAFLFIAGYAHGLGLRKRQTRQFGVSRRLWRLAGIAALGGIMHFPWTEVLAGRWREGWHAWNCVDILPCLAAAIGLIVVLERWCGRWIKAVIGFSAAAVLVISPQIALWSDGPIPVLAWLNRTHGSLFPLFPWAAFAFLGYVASSRPPTFRAFAVPVLSAAASLFFLERQPFSSAGPAFFFERLAWILAFVPICGWLSARWSPPVVLFAGRESLVMYLGHLVLIAFIAGAGVSALGVSVLPLLAGVLAASFGITWAWRTFSVWSADRARLARHPQGSSAPAG
jgi:hypothetical protein